FLGIYIFFLLMLALGLFFSEDWGSRIDSVIKLIVVIFNIVYTFEEIDQLTKEGRDYFAWTNLFDVLGIVAIYALIPLYAFGEYKIYYGVASAAFILNFFRVLKFFATFEVGNYARVFMFLLKEDVWVFLQFFAVLMVAFTGAVFLALKSEMSDGGKIIDGKNETLTIWSTMLREARALAEGKEFADDYDGVYSFPLVIFLLINMAAIIVVLSNILIGQISARYEDAAKDAKIQSDIAKAKVICKIEKSRFVWRNLRIKHYMPGDHVTDEALVKERLSEWYELKKDSDSNRNAIK
uniref:Ion transport domain-containing protein n=1 Tax=Clytia hemisphaerica TaxID=252671 RepID=A0A7M6DPQ2_9CNID